MRKIAGNLKSFLSLVVKSLKLGFQVNGSFSNFILFLGIPVAFFPAIVSGVFSSLSDHVQSLYTSQNEWLFKVVIAELMAVMALKMLEHIYQMIQKRCAVKNAEKMAIYTGPITRLSTM